jgi:hypothetical protein
MSSLQLHPSLGINAHLTFCPRCGGDGPDLMLIGSRTSILQCNSCGITIYGHKPSKPCPKCKNGGPYSTGNFTHVGTIGERDKLPGSLCDKCKAEIESFKKIVADGGIYFKCKTCKNTGVIKSKSDICRLVREKLKVEKPDPCGIEFENCEQHAVEESETKKKSDAKAPD